MRGARVIYSVAEMQWLEANRMLVISDYFKAFQAAFARTDVSMAHLHGLRKRKGWKVGRAPGRTRGRHLKFNTAEIAWLKGNCTLVIGDYHRAFCAEFSRTDMSAEQLNALRKRQGWRTGRTGQYPKGAVPLNKGKKCPPGVGGRHPNARKTQFVKGGLPHNFCGAGHERIDEKDGYVVMIIAEKNPWTGADTRPVLKHRHLWEQVHGQLLDGYCLKCLDGDKTNCDPSNWEAIPRALLPRLNGGRNKTHVAYDEASSELKPIILATAKLNHAVRARRSVARK
jgi:hypothetical protein